MFEIFEEREPDGVDKNGPEITNDFKGLKIMLLDDKKLIVRGVYRTFVNCGSQLAIWHLFPSEVLFTLKNTITGDIYQSVDYSTMNISYYTGDGDPRTPNIYDEYGKKPCDQMVREYFELNLFESISDLPASPAKYEISAKIHGDESNKLVVKFKQ